MPNYSLILDTKFKPFSYQEMLAPVQAATQAHQVLEEEYSAITAKAGEIASKANEQTDPLAYKMYRQYADDLEARADQLLKYGLNTSSRANMLDLKARFSKEILPIEVAYKRREALADEQRKAYAANPTLRYQRYARNMSLDEFINNPSSDYGESFSGALLAQQAGAMAANLKTALTGVGKMKSNGLPFQYEKLIQYGFRPEDIQFAINNPKDPKAAPILNTIIDQVLTANGINRWASPELLNEARAFANMGLYNAIGQTQIKDYKDDFGARVAADAINRRAAAREAAQRAQPQHFHLTPRAIRSKEEVSKANQELNQYRKYFYTDPKTGHYKMTTEGRREYYRMEPAVGGGTGGFSASKAPSTPSNFRRFMDRIGGAKYMGQGKNWQPGNAGLVFQRYIKSNEEDSYDAYHTTEYDWSLAGDYRTDYFKAYKSRTNTPYTVKWDSKQRKWVKDKELKWGDLEGYTASAVRYSRHGDTLMLDADGKEPLRVKLPAGFSASEQHNVLQAIQQADIYHMAATSGYTPIIDPYTGALQTETNKYGIEVPVFDRTSPMSADDRLMLEYYRDKYLDDMMATGSQYVIPAKTKTEEYGIFPQ